MSMEEQTDSLAIVTTIVLGLAFLLCLPWAWSLDKSQTQEPVTSQVSTGSCIQERGGPLVDGQGGDTPLAQ